MKRGTSHVMLAFTETYVVSFEKNNKNWLIFGNSIIGVAKSLVYNKAILLVLVWFGFFPLSSLASAGFISSLSTTSTFINGLKE